MGYGRDVGLAAAWATSVDKLTARKPPPARPSRVSRARSGPNSLLDVAQPGEAAEYRRPTTRSAGLFRLLACHQAKSEDGAAKGFTMHRLVQDFARRAMAEERKAARWERRWLGWMRLLPVIPGTSRTWPTLDPLAPHALQVAESERTGPQSRSRRHDYSIILGASHRQRQVS